MDPRTETGGVEKRRNPLSPLMRAKSKAADGQKVIFCPFHPTENDPTGHKAVAPCAEEDHDEKGHCYHLVGFTVPGNPKLYEPYMPPVADGFDDPKELSQHMGFPCRVHEAGVRKVLGRKTEKVQKNDILVQISCSHRVYRNVERPAWADRIEADELSPEPA